MSQPLLLGTAKRDITPPRPVPLAGFAHRSSVYDGIAQRLYARFWFFSQPGESGRATKALLIQADLIWWGSERMEPILDKLSERWGLAREAIILHASHTHGGPQTTNRFVSQLGKPDTDYLDWLEEELLAGVGQAYSSLEPVTMEKETGSCTIGINRRKPVDGRIDMAPYPEGITDPEVTVIRFTAEGGQVKGLWFHYACHPTTTGDNLVTSEFPGMAMEMVEKALGGQVPASFLQGFCGDIRPALIKDGQFFRGTDDDVKRLGEQLGAEVLRIIDGPMQSLSSRPLQARTSRVELEFAKYLSIEELEADSGTEGAAGDRSRLLLKDPARNREPAGLELCWIELAAGLSLLAANGEIVVEYGLFLKQQVDEGILPLGYCNGMVGYVPTAAQSLEGGYEGGGSAVYFGLPGPFSSSLEPQIKSAMEQLVKTHNTIG